MAMGLPRRCMEARNVTGNWTNILKRTGEPDLGAAMVRLATLAARRHAALAHIEQTGGTGLVALQGLSVLQDLNTTTTTDRPESDRPWFIVSVPASSDDRKEVER